MNVFTREMRANRKSLIFWCIGMLFMVAAGMSKYAAYSATNVSINDLLKQLPMAVRALIGVSFDLSTVRGYYGVLFPYLAIMATIHASMLGTNIIAKEERDRTSEFLFVKPTSRIQIVTAKLLAALVNISILNIVTLISSIAIVQYYGKGEAVREDILTLMLGMYILQLMFMVIGSAIAAISKNPKTAASVAMTFLLATYILSIVIDINDKLEALKYFTPFKYFDAKMLLLEGGFDPLFNVLSSAIIALCLVITYVFYKKRDLKI